MDDLQKLLADYRNKAVGAELRARDLRKQAEVADAEHEAWDHAHDLLDKVIKARNAPRPA